MQSARSTVAIIFSKDRAMQLDACLRSFALHCQDSEVCTQRVLYTCSHTRSEAQYEELRRVHRHVEFVREGVFQDDVITAMEGFSFVLFLVDDNLFVRPWSLANVLHIIEQHHQAIGFSLRLGRNTTFCYSQNAAQKIPDFEEVTPDIVKYSWTQAEHDFGYPLEVSSSIYRTCDVLPVIRSSSNIPNPNAQEVVLDKAKEQFRATHGQLLCFATSVSFCNPANIVRLDWANRSQIDFRTSVHALMRKFDLGYRIDLKPFTDFVPSACHQEVEFEFTIPPMKWRSLSATIEANQENEAAGEGPSQLSASCVIKTCDLPHEDKELVLTLIRVLSRSPDSRTLSDWLLNLLRDCEQLRRDELADVTKIIATLRERLVQSADLAKNWYEPELARLHGIISEARAEVARLNTLKETWYEPELIRLREEGDQLRAEMATVGHRAVRTARNLLIQNMPWAYQLARNMLHGMRFLWRQRWKLTRSVSLITNKWNVHTIVNRPWLTDAPLVSIVITNYNYGQYLHEAIDSVLAQTFQDFEIIVIDDGSTDPDTKRVIATLNKPKTRVIVQANQGLPGARNSGVRAARGKYVCCLDADDRLKPTYLEKCVYWLETKNLDICFSWLQKFGASHTVWKNGPFLIDHLLKANTVSVAAMFKKSMWEETGGFKEAMGNSYDDWEFWVTLAEHGAIGHCIPEALFLYRRHPQSMSAGLRDQLDRIHEKIKSLHPSLYANGASSLVRKLRKRQERRYLVVNPHCNLLRRRDDSGVSGSGNINILLALPWFDLGGSSVIKKEVFAQLKHQGINVTAIATNIPEGSHTESGLYLYEDLTHDCFNLPRFLTSENTVQFVEYLIRSRHVNVLFLAGSRPAYEMLPHLRRTFPALKVMDELYNLVGHIDNNRDFQRFIDLNVVVNEDIRDRLVGLGESEHRIRVIYPGIDTDRFDPKSASYVFYAERRPCKEFTFGFLGRLSPEKRPQDIVRLALQLRSCRFRLCGDGPIEALVRRDILAGGVSDRVHYEGVSKNPIEFLAGIDALIVPSEIEGLPLVLLEAMALELPVIATAVGGIPHVIVQGVNGFLYEPGRIDELNEIAERLSRMAESERRVIGRRARQTVLSNYTISRCSEDYMATLRSLLERE